MNDSKLMEKITSLAKRRGFIFQGSEIYGGIAGMWDYGPLGSLLKRNIEDSWLNKFVNSRSDMFLLDSAILMNEKVWQTTGHTEKFSDPMVEDKKTKNRYRADFLLEENGINASKMDIEEMAKTIKEKKILSPEGNPLGEVQEFNMMLKTQIGAVEDSSSTSYLRPETAQGIFVNFKNVIDSMHPKLPFGIAQIGKAFRNEITPRDFIFRTREIDQMEIEYFVKAEEWEQHFNYWRDEMLEWMEEIGLDMTKVNELDVPKVDRAHYSEKTIDIEFDFPFGRSELYGLAYRSDYDLAKHTKAGNEKLEYTENIDGKLDRITPHIIEPSFGMGRTVLALLLSVYREDEVNGEIRSYLALDEKIAPYKIAVSPLLKNKVDLVEKAQEVFGKLKAKYGNVVYDDNGNIGKRYRRQDEIGTPHCVTIDFDTLEDDTVTVRDRDTAEQTRVKISELDKLFK